MFSIRRFTLIVLLAIAFAGLCAPQFSDPTLVKIESGTVRGLRRGHLVEGHFLRSTSRWQPALADAAAGAALDGRAGGRSNPIHPVIVERIDADVP
jgi:hypothetical protein